MDQKALSPYQLVLWPALITLLVTGWAADKLPWWVSFPFFVWLLLSFAAMLMQAEARTRMLLADTLEDRRYTHIYRALAQPLLDWLWNRLGDPAETRAPLPALLRGALTWRVYDLALRLAVAYPLLALVAVWLAGSDAKLGPEAVVFPAAPFWPDRAVVVGQIILLAAGFAGEKMLATSQHRVLRQAAGWLPTVGWVAVVGLAWWFGETVAFAGAFAGAVAVAFAVAFAFAVAGAVAGAVAVASAFAGAVAVAVAFAVAVAIERMDKAGRPRLARVILTLTLPLLWVATAALVDFATLKPIQQAAFLFLGVLPLINALFDALSYGVTLALLRRGLRGQLPVLFGFVDVLVALVMFLALGAAMVLVIAGLNAVGAAPVFDLAGLFAGLRAAPGDYWWLYLMLFSTLLPTAIHLIIALLGLQGITPRKWRRAVAALVRRAPDDHIAATCAPFLTGAVWAVPVLLALAVASGLGYWLRDFAAAVGSCYLTALEALAHLVAAL